MLDIECSINYTLLNNLDWLLNKENASHKLAFCLFDEHDQRVLQMRSSSSMEVRPQSGF